MWVIVPCGAAKRDQPCAAGLMYTGAFHRACLRYARSLAPATRVVILSAKYGLIPLGQVIVPYNLKMGQPGCVSVETVREQAKALGVAGDVVALGGALYTDMARQVWPDVQTPFATVGGMGYHLYWMKRYHGRLPDRPLPHNRASLAPARVK